MMLDISTALATIVPPVRSVALLVPQDSLDGGTAPVAAVSLESAVLALLAFTLGAMALLLLWRLLSDLRGGDVLSIETHWGGVGGGLGGWRISPPVFYLIGSVAFASLFTVVTLRIADRIEVTPPLSGPPAERSTVVGDSLEGQTNGNEPDSSSTNQSQ